MKGIFFAIIALIILFISSCKDEKPVGMTNLDVTKMPTMTTRNAESLISDSGITRYRMTAPLWLVYDRADDPYWRFPEGLYLERFNLLMKPEATVESDSAHYYSNRQLWQLDGNVEISNIQGERFVTQQLFWDQQQHTVYSDSFIHIEQPNRVLEGYGFTSNETMTAYTINQVSGIFPAATFTKKAQ